jgi:hypothetical protein
MDWLGYSGKALDTDLTDERAWQARPELAAASKARMAKEAKALASANMVGQASLAKASVTKLDTDHTDEAAWKRRAELKERSRKKREEEARRLAEANRSIFSAIAKTTRSDEIDDNLMDEEEWQIRPDLALVSLERREKEAEDLVLKNRILQQRLQSIKPMVNITSPSGKAKYDGNGESALCPPSAEPPPPAPSPSHCASYAWLSLS